MYKNLKWKLIVIAAVAALGIFMFVPPSQKVKLGLDLKGGIHLVLKVNTGDALELEVETTADQFRQELVDAGLTAVTAAPDSESSFLVSGIPEERDQELRRLADNSISLAQQYDREQVAGSGPLSYRFRLKPNVAQRLREESVQQAILVGLQVERGIAFRTGGHNEGSSGGPRASAILCQPCARHVPRRRTTA